jgi:hypothetical protein
MFLDVSGVFLLIKIIFPSSPLSHISIDALVGSDFDSCSLSYDCLNIAQLVLQLNLGLFYVFIF